MKKIKLTALVASAILVFSSCSTEETFTPEVQSADLLKSFKIKRDASGAYSLDYDLHKNAAADNVVDESNNTNNIYLYSTENQLSKKLTQDLLIDGEQLKVGFINAGSMSSNITIIDDNITLAKKNNDTKLKDYSIESNEDGTYTLDFNVSNKVNVDFVYNEEISTYEIHLEEGKSTTTSFSRVLEREDGELLKIDFINYKSNLHARGEDTTLTTKRKKPRIIIGMGHDDVF